jgi:hypothetical protein
MSLTVQISLPLPFVNFPFRTVVSPPSPRSSRLVGPRTSRQELQQLTDIICAHRRINISIWSSLCSTEETLTYQSLLEFQDSLLEWKAQAICTFQNYDDFPSLGDSTVSCSSLHIPPNPQLFTSLDAALAAAIFHCYMGRSFCMMSMIAGVSEGCERAAVLHAYHNLRIIQGVETEITSRERQLYSRNTVKIGFIPLLFLGAQFCLNSTWRDFTIDKIQSIGQEGLYNGETFARALQSLGQFQAHAQKLDAMHSTSNAQTSRNLEVSVRFNVVAVLIPGTEENSAVAYYVRALIDKPQNIAEVRRKYVQVVGRARWSRSTSATSTNVSMELFDADHHINQGLRDHCLYFQLAANEPIARDWESMLGPESLGHHGYFVRMAASRNAYAQGLIARLETNTGMEQF